ncbi:hypothetical protein GUJ93_ZPchr0003g16698 [Zizania palustris]|uniref:Uncharacterized protein n=1 Tax=Zizania palustris TaxID=103762 RepID=A0A8J5STH6_ZIZPA|nr:hypothetical protein GUJ93_ZPchr0003g16698 [Zizania palustris]
MDRCPNAYCRFWFRFGRSWLAVAAARAPPWRSKGAAVLAAGFPNLGRKDAADAVIWIYAELTPSPFGSMLSDSRRRWKGK